MKAILIGYGEIGQAVYNVFSLFHQITIIDPAHGRTVESKADILLVAIPYSGDFIEVVRAYQQKHDVKSTIVFSTVAVGTCVKLGAVHSPVEGKHPELTKSIKTMRRWIGGRDKLALDFIGSAFFPDQMMIVDHSEFTEFLKLRSTSLYGLNIEFARYSKEVCDKLGMDFDNIREFDLDYNQLYKALNMPQFSRYILFPPEGKLGGHCVTPNAKILDEQFPSDFLKKIYQ